MRAIQHPSPGDPLEDTRARVTDVAELDPGRNPKAGEYTIFALMFVKFIPEWRPIRAVAGGVKGWNT